MTRRKLVTQRFTFGHQPEGPLLRRGDVLKGSEGERRIDPYEGRRVVVAFKDLVAPPIFEPEFVSEVDTADK